MNGLTITKTPGVYYQGMYTGKDGKSLHMARMVRAYVKDVVSGEEFCIDYNFKEPHPIMFAKKGATIFVDGIQDGTVRLGGGSIARIIKRIKATSVEVENSDTMSLTHDCYCGNCLRHTQ